MSFVLPQVGPFAWFFLILSDALVHHLIDWCLAYVPWIWVSFRSDGLDQTKNAPPVTTKLGNITKMHTAVPKYSIQTK
jgi:hypothetical protein